MAVSTAIVLCGGDATEMTCVWPRVRISDACVMETSSGENCGETSRVALPNSENIERYPEDVQEKMPLSSFLSLLSPVLLSPLSTLAQLPPASTSGKMFLTATPSLKRWAVTGKPSYEYTESGMSISTVAGQPNVL